MVKFVVLPYLFAIISLAATPEPYRVQKYAAYKAHSILPGSLKFLVKKNGKHLFAGMEQGLRVPSHRIDADLILRETEKISVLISKQRPFPEVVHQMGFVSGLVAVHTDPSIDGESYVKTGFNYYSNLKLSRFLFVFDGYEALALDRGLLAAELERIPKKSTNHRQLLDKRYQSVKGNSHYRFSERSAVFGVCSIYFSNLARLSAHLWYYAWIKANGDVTETPFLKRQYHKKVGS